MTPGISTSAYRYVGPEAIRAAAADAAPGTAIGRATDLSDWLAAHVADREDGATPATFVVTVDGILRIASRRSEHVACAGGQPVLAAGEIFFARGACVAVSNLSTGYCPRPDSYAAVAAALARAGIAHPPAYTAAFEFRRCPACGERNLVKDDHFACALCDAELPEMWNF
ncbi:MAG: hypothetical protein K8W52_09000 [Deltaproteobacteria bacterium]|nr:hypothetical protein [Deltaproteobacteria bacterium]